MQSINDAQFTALDFESLRYRILSAVATLQNDNFFVNAGKWDVSRIANKDIYIPLTDKVDGFEYGAQYRLVVSITHIKVVKGIRKFQVELYVEQALFDNKGTLKGYNAHVDNPYVMRIAYSGQVTMAQFEKKFTAKTLSLVAVESSLFTTITLLKYQVLKPAIYTDKVFNCVKIN